MFTITEDISITLMNGVQIPAKPRILLDRSKVILSSLQRNDEIATERLESIGSIEDWLYIVSIDSLAFDTNTRQLKAASFYYPEFNMEPANLHLLATAEKLKGLPVLNPDAPSFELTPFEYRHYHQEGDLLLCFGDDFPEVGHLQEIAISGEVSLFFSDGRYCAWGVYHPEKYIVDHIAATVDQPTDQFLKQCLYDALDLITDITVIMMKDKDTSVLGDIAALHNRIVVHGAVDGSPLAIIRDWLYDVAKTFYKDMVEGLFTR